jgi:hypothetical protein
VSFASGSIGMRMFYLPDGLPPNVLEKFASHAAPPLDALGSEPITGWVTSRHLLDRQINEDTAIVAGYLHLYLMKAERKIPDALLRTECKIEEFARLQVEGKEYLPRKIRMEIKKEITERLLPTMPPLLTGIPMVYDSRAHILYAGAMSDKQHDAFTINFRNTTGADPIPLVPDTAALKRKQVNLRDLDPTSFSPECDDDVAPESIGQDFLTWLWFFSEARGGILTLNESDRFAIIIEGPVTFVREADGAHETVLRKGSPLASGEAKAALLAGKKVASARLILARGEDVWSTMLGAHDFKFRGLKMPGSEEKLDPISRFQERMVSLGVFRDAFLEIFDRFLDERAHHAKWTETQQEIHKWVSDRKARS